MKYKIFSIGIAMSLLLGGCSDDRETYEILQPEEKEGVITFVLPGMKKGVPTYAEVAATTGESSLEDLSIYMFKDDGAKGGKLERAFDFGDDNVAFGTTDDNKPTATIDLTGRTGLKKLYFIGNGLGKIIGMDKVTVGITTEAEFIEFVTEKADTLATPLLVSTILPIDLDAPLTDDEKKIELKRRVSRFDVSNITANTNFEIKKIYVSNANLQGYVFGEAEGKETIETGELKMIDFSSKTDANQGEAKSVFYMYPVKLGPGGASISFEGNFKGETETKIYSLNPSQEIDLHPNMRYMLKAKAIDDKEVAFEVSVASWADGEEEELTSKSHLLEYAEIEMIGGRGITVVNDTTFDITGATQSATLSIPVNTNNKFSATARITYLNGTDNALPGLAINNPSPVLTYGSSYLLDYKITIPLQTIKVPLDAKIEIINNNYPEDRKTIFVQSRPDYHDTSLKPVLLGGIYWAPVNAGADGATSVEEHGKLYQWGRNYGAVYGTTNDLYDVIGPISQADADDAAKAKDKFIKVESYPLDWLTPRDSTLWIDDKIQGPCPDGWRVPSKKELNKIFEAFSNGKATFEENAKPAAVESDNQGEYLYLTYSGYRSYLNGNSVSKDKYGYYWYHDLNFSSYYSSVLSINSDLHIINESRGYNGEALSVRCIQK